MTTTSTVTMFYIGNFADMDTFEGDTDTENPGLVLGVYGGLQQVAVTEVDVDDDGVIYDDEFATGDFLSYDTGAGAVSVNLDSSSLYNAEILLGDGSTMSVPVLVIQAANGDVFISEFPGNPLDNLAIQSIELVSLNTSDATGINRGASNVQNTRSVCYSAGTLIAVPDGAVPVETLRSGDLVLTHDHGPQPVRWIHRHDLPLDGTAEDATPVLIAAGALGAGVPETDLVVSSQHRILVGGAGQLQDRFTNEVFVPAKSLTGLRGIRRMHGKKRITWVHFACDGHEVVRANGCLSESLLLGAMVVNGLDARMRRRLSRIFGPAQAPAMALNGPPARVCLTVGAVRQTLGLCPLPRCAPVPLPA